MINEILAWMMLVLIFSLQITLLAWYTRWMWRRLKQKWAKAMNEINGIYKQKEFP